MADATRDKKEVEKNARKLLEETRTAREKEKIRKADALLVCLDIIALYEKDEDMKPLVKDAEGFRDKLRKQ